MNPTEMKPPVSGQDQPVSPTPPQTDGSNYTQEGGFKTVTPPNGTPMMSKDDEQMALSEAEEKKQTLLAQMETGVNPIDVLIMVRKAMLDSGITPGEEGVEFKAIKFMQSLPENILAKVEEAVQMLQNGEVSEEKMRELMEIGKSRHDSTDLYTESTENPQEDAMEDMEEPLESGRVANPLDLPQIPSPKASPMPENGMALPEIPKNLIK